MPFTDFYRDGQFIDRVEGILDATWPPDADDRAYTVRHVYTADDVAAERERRLALGFDCDFGDERGVHRIGTTPADMAGWQEVTTLAQARLARADETPIAIMSDTGPALVTPTEWMAVLEAAAAFRQPLWAKSFALQAQDPIPADYADDSYWS